MFRHTDKEKIEKTQITELQNLQQKRSCYYYLCNYKDSNKGIP